MNWDRVEVARRRAQGLLLLAASTILVTMFLFLAAPSFTGGFGYVEPVIATIPISMLAPVAAFGSMLFGLAWMWRIYRAPTAFDSPRWRYRDR